MDQEAWNQIYADLERDLAAAKTRDGAIREIDVIIEIDRARFAMDRGDGDEAIARIQEIKRRLRGPVTATTRSVPTSPVLDRLEALEDNLHGSLRLGSARLEIVGEDEEEEGEPTRSAAKNTKVAKSIRYDDIKDEYLRLWETSRIRPEKASAVRREAERLLANRKVYEEISEETSVPWWFIGLIHQMECSYSLAKHLHNGDSLKARTWQVPAGRPKDGSAPFTFQESAIDALEVDGFAGKTDWPLPMVLWRLERYNGFGYRKKFGFASPYLWSYTNHFTAGKYVRDGVFDPNAVSKQCGTSATLRDLLERGLVRFEEGKPEPVLPTAAKPAATEPPKPVVAPPPVAAPAPAPAAVVTPAPPASPTPVTTPAPDAVPAPAPGATTVAAPPPQPVAAPIPAPIAMPAPAEAPASVAPPPVAAPPAAATIPPATAPAPAPGSVAAAAPSPVLAATTAAAPTDKPAETPPPPAAGVSPAVAAALAELARRKS